MGILRLFATAAVADHVDRNSATVDSKALRLWGHLFFWAGVAVAFTHRMHGFGIIGGVMLSLGWVMLFLRNLGAKNYETAAAMSFLGLFIVLVMFLIGAS